VPGAPYPQKANLKRPYHLIVIRHPYPQFDRKIFLSSFENARDSGIVVEHLPHHPMVKGLSPAAPADTNGLYYTRIMIVNDASRAVSELCHNLERHSRSIIDNFRIIIDDSRSLIDDSRSIIETLEA
jgi:hypothetical protein